MKIVFTLCDITKVFMFSIDVMFFLDIFLIDSTDIEPKKMEDQWYYKPLLCKLGLLVSFCNSLL